MTEANTSAGLAALKFQVDPNQLRLDLHIDMTNLDEAMMRQASLYSHYASNSVNARHQYEKMKRMLEILEADLDKNYRHTLKDANPKTTEPEIAAAIKGDPKWRKVSGLVLDAQHIYQLAQVAERAIDQRRELLIQIAKDAAREQAGQVRVVANRNAKELLLQTMRRNEEAIAGAAGKS